VSRSDEGTPLFLWNHLNKSIEIELSVMSLESKWHYRSAPYSFEPAGAVNPEGTGLNGWGFKNFATHLTLFNSLANGTLLIEVHTKLASPTKVVPPPFIPANPFAKIIQRMIIDENIGDMLSAIGGQQKKNNAKKVANITPFQGERRSYLGVVRMTMTSVDSIPIQFHVCQ
jgi:hypothetical protein